MQCGLYSKLLHILYICKTCHENSISIEGWFPPRRSRRIIPLINVVYFLSITWYIKFCRATIIISLKENKVDIKNG